MLEQYQEKRDFRRTSEPDPQVQGGEGPLIFVVQKHAARRLHYDFRLELDGVLKSWAVPKGPSLDPSQKRLAAMVEDHPFDYHSFEGVIPKGQYGGGEVIVWDRGTYSPDEGGELSFNDHGKAAEEARDGLSKGKLSFTLRGHKLKGSWTLVKMAKREKDWLLIKHRDDYADADRDILKDEVSAISGLTIDDLKSGKKPEDAEGTSANPAELPGARKSRFPSSVKPMLATPVSKAFNDPDWLFEPKLDGYRAIAFVKEGEARLHSRRGLDISTKYSSLLPELQQQPAAELILDGEIIALDEKGRSCFQCLQQYLKAMQGRAHTEPSIPLVYYIFDILYLDGYDLREVPLSNRKDLLQATLKTSEHIRVVDFYEKEGKTVYKAAIDNGLEGAIAKQRHSIYETGKRSRSWLKVKPVLTGDFVITGYNRGSSSRANTFGALLLGYYDDEGNLVYSGHVGSGFDEQALNDLRQRLDKLITDDCPFLDLPPLNAPTTWVSPELVAEVKYEEVTQDGYLRIPVFLRLRDDKPAGEVHHPEPTLSTPVEVGIPRVTKKDATEEMLAQIGNDKDSFSLKVEDEEVGLTNLGKELWPDITKRDLITYLVKVSPYILPHLKDRPLTFSRYPDGVSGEHFYQRHWDNPLPPFVDKVNLPSEHGTRRRDYMICNNLATLLWLGQLANLEIHTWFSRVVAMPDLPAGSEVDYLIQRPDFIIFDIDPYLYSGNEAEGAEPELNPDAFNKGCQATLWLKEVLDDLSLFSFVKTSGRTGLHIYVPILRQFDYGAVRSAARTIGRFLHQKHPEDITLDWAVEKRTGKVFIDYNQNVRGKTLASIYSPRPSSEATVSIPLRWNELGKVYPTDFTILNVPDRLAAIGEIWAGILEAKSDLSRVLRLSSE
jgi:bifunctional non-homologous end joining protein LigD